jgi:WD40 repeat protein
MVNTLWETGGTDDRGANDTTIRIWEADSGKNILVIEGHTQQVTSGNWSPDGKYIAVSLDQYPGLMVFRAWQSTQERLDYAKECCVFRPLGDLERQQSGLSGMD